jgi:hypothetical protein
MSSTVGCSAQRPGVAFNGQRCHAAFFAGPVTCDWPRHMLAAATRLAVSRFTRQTTAARTPPSRPARRNARTHAVASAACMMLHGLTLLHPAIWLLVICHTNNDVCSCAAGLPHTAAALDEPHNDSPNKRLDGQHVHSRCVLVVACISKQAKHSANRFPKRQSPVRLGWQHRIDLL